MTAQRGTMFVAHPNLSGERDALRCDGLSAEGWVQSILREMDEFSCAGKDLLNN